MTNNQYVRLSDRGLLRIRGADGKKFLQGLITNDMEKISEGHAIHAGLLTAQGKIISDFFVLSYADGYFLETGKKGLPDLVKRLNFYKLRAHVEIEDCTTYQVMALWGASCEPPQEVFSFPDPRSRELGWRVLVQGEKAADFSPSQKASEQDYHAHRISIGIPEGGRDFQYGSHFPHDAGFDQLGGISFQKGCYIGQEVVSRMEHRGSGRKRIVGVSATSALPESGTEIIGDDQTIGVLGSVVGERGLALLRLDRAEKAIAKNIQILAGSTPLTLIKPNWMS